MLRRLGLLLAFGVLGLLLLAYAAVVFPSLPWWGWVLGLLGAYAVRRWWRERRALGAVDVEGRAGFATVRGGGK